VLTILATDLLDKENIESQLLKPERVAQASPHCSAIQIFVCNSPANNYYRHLCRSLAQRFTRRQVCSTALSTPCPNRSTLRQCAVQPEHVGYNRAIPLRRRPALLPKY